MRFSVLFLALFLGACFRHETPESLGEHNLSKGKCVNIPACSETDCPRLEDEGVQYVCEMLGGEFEPREFKRSWL